MAPQVLVHADVRTDRSIGYWRILGLVAVFAMRLPFLDAGYGTNIDAWRVAHVARQLAETGQYEASRLPGYPVHEIVCAMAAAGGPIALNGLSALFSVAAVIAIWRIARQLQCRDSLLVALALAGTPVFFVNSVTTKDYVSAIAFLLWASDAAIRRRPVACGVLLGLAIGCRITSAAMIIPLAMILYGNDRARWRGAVIRASACAVLVAATTFAPVLLRYGTGFLTFYDNHARPDTATMLGRGTLEVWGTIGVAGLIVAVLAALRLRQPNATSLARPANPLIIPALATMIVIYLVAYLRLPDQAGYLLPVVPAALLLVARFSPRAVLQFACICLCVAPWIDFEPAGAPTAGAILTDHRERLRTVSDVQRFIAMSEQALPGGVTVVVGGWQPMIAELFTERDALRNNYVYLLSVPELKSLRESGGEIAYSSDAIRAFNFRVYGADLATFGARNLRELFIGQR